MKIGDSIPQELVEFADDEARRLGTSRSSFLARLLDAERIRQQARAYLDQYGSDIGEDDSAWQEYQRKRAALEHADDDW